MSKSEILAELPKLSSSDRSEIWEHLWRIEATSGPTEAEKALLNEAQADYDAAPAAGGTWTEV